MEEGKPMKYEILIEQSRSRVEVVEAESLESAIDIAICGAEVGEFDMDDPETIHETTAVESQMSGTGTVTKECATCMYSSVRGHSLVCEMNNISDGERYGLLSVDPEFFCNKWEYIIQ